MWKKQLLKLSPQAKTALDNNLKGIASPFLLSVSGTKIGVHNWSHGIEEKSNRYLSPENAINVFVKKLTDYADPNRPRDVQDIIGIMVTTSDIDVFITELEKVRLLLNEPTFRQALDYAKSSKTLQESKMIKTQTIVGPAFCNQADITPSANRTMQGVLRNAASTASAVATADPLKAIEALKKMKAERELKNQQQVTTLLNTTAQVYAFAVRGFLEEAEAGITQNLPGAGNVFTAAILFVGPDLSTIKGMLSDVISK